MISPNSNNARSNTEPELTLGDVIAFVTKAKWFSLTGIFIGTVIAGIYLVTAPAVYQSSVTVQINAVDSANRAISASECLERLALGNEILTLMQPALDENNIIAIKNAINSATVSKTGNFLTYNVKTNSAVSSQELALSLANGTIAFTEQLKAPTISSLQKKLAMQQAFLEKINSSKYDSYMLQFSILENELLLSSQSNSKSLIFNGPTVSSSPILPKPKPILLLGALLGIALGLALFYLKDNYKISKATKFAHKS